MGFCISLLHPLCMGPGRSPSQSHIPTLVHMNIQPQLNMVPLIFSNILPKKWALGDLSIRTQSQSIGSGSLYPTNHGPLNLCPSKRRPWNIHTLKHLSTMISPPLTYFLPPPPPPCTHGYWYFLTSPMHGPRDLSLPILNLAC